MPQYLFLFFLLLPLSLFAEIAGLPFESPEQEQQYRDLSAELRCLVCQNQSLADSNASLAQDLRLELYEQVISGQTEDDIIQFMTDRYGEFILYKPRLTVKTILLWFSPFLLLIIAGFLMVKFSHAQKNNINNMISDEERQRVRELLEAAEPEENGSQQ